jgi:hypothetical protein
VSIGGLAAVINSVAGDGSSVNLIPIPGTGGVASVDGIVVAGAPNNLVTMNTVQAIAPVPALTPLEGTETPETAPTLTVPAAGSSFVLTDAGAFAGEPTDCCFGFHPRIYRLTITAPTTLDFTLEWFTGEDLGIYITTDDLITGVGVGDDLLEGPDGHPETTGPVVFTPGTYFVNLVNFSASTPAFFQLTVDNP